LSFHWIIKTHISPESSRLYIKLYIGQKIWEQPVWNLGLYIYLYFNFIHGMVGASWLSFWSVDKIIWKKKESCGCRRPNSPSLCCCSYVSTWSVLLVEDTGVPRENHWSAASHWHTLWHNVASSTHRLSGFRTRNTI
jgi:hypothetical protein